MTRRAVLLIALCAASTFAEVPEFSGPLVDKAKESIIAAQRDSEAAAADLGKKCHTEATSIEGFDEELSKAGRMMGRARVDSATTQRAIEDLEYQIRSLLRLRSRLGDHVRRVNAMYLKMHDSSLEDVKTAAVVMRDLGGMLQMHEEVAAVALDPIDMVPSPVEEEFVAAKEEKAAAFLELTAALERRVARHAAALDPTRANSFIDSYKSAVALHNGALSHWRRVRDEFEQERSALSTFLELLDTILNTRNVRLTTMRHSLDKDGDSANAEAEADQARVASMREKVGEHQTLFGGACHDAQRVHDFFTEQRAHMLSAVEGGSLAGDDSTAAAATGIAAAVQAAATAGAGGEGIRVQAE